MTQRKRKQHQGQSYENVDLKHCQKFITFVTESPLIYSTETLNYENQTNNCLKIVASLQLSGCIRKYKPYNFLKFRESIQWEQMRNCYTLNIKNKKTQTSVRIKLI